MIRAIVIDDEWYNLEETSQFIEETGFFHVEGKYQNPLKALEEASKTNPQVAFIDIELPEMDGITLAEKILEINPSIIIVFITSYNQYAVQAFDLNAMDYILKPIKKQRFNRMIEKIKTEINYRKQMTSKILEINCFPHFNVTIGDTPVKWQRAKAEELFAYLLMYHGRAVHKEKIIEDIWPGHQPEKALQILQTSVCKIRNLFSQIKNMVRLDYSSNKYSLLIDGGECDYFQIQSALDYFKPHDQSTYDAVEEAYILYGKGFLTEEGYLWSIGKDKEIQQALNHVVDEMLNSYRIEENKEKILRMLKLKVNLTPFDEELNLKIMDIYKENGDKPGLMNHYQWLEKILREGYDAEPSEKIKAMAGLL